MPITAGAEIAGHVDQERLVRTACSLVDIPDPTGTEQSIGEPMADLMHPLGLQPVAAGRAGAPQRARHSRGARGVTRPNSASVTKSCLRTLRSFTRCINR